MRALLQDSPRATGARTTRPRCSRRSWPSTLLVSWETRSEGIAQGQREALTQRARPRRSPLVSLRRVLHRPGRCASDEADRDAWFDRPGGFHVGSVLPADGGSVGSDGRRWCGSELVVWRGPPLTDVCPSVPSPSPPLTPPHPPPSNCTRLLNHQVLSPTVESAGRRTSE